MKTGWGAGECTLSVSMISLAFFFYLYPSFQKEELRRGLGEWI